MFRLFEARRALGRAERLLRQGRPAEAASIFDDLAREAEGRGMLDRAGDLYLRAARCYLALDDLDRADERATKAIRLFLRAGRPMKVRRLLPKVVGALERRGRHAEAEELRKEVAALLGPPPVGRPFGPAIARGELPAKCPHCGAPVKPDEVSWVGPRTAECPYCGSVLKAA